MHYTNACRKYRPRDRVLLVDLHDNNGGAWGYGLGVAEERTDAVSRRRWVNEPRMASFEGIGKQITASCLYPPLRWNAVIQTTLTALAASEGILASAA